MEQLGQMNYSCEKCDFVTKFSNCLGRHDGIKHRDVRYKCKICEKEYKTPEQVTQHFIERSYMKGYALIVKVVTISPLQKVIYEFKFSHSTRV
jgi:hypothetical protein